MDDWILKAIEREAMSRARQERDRTVNDLRVGNCSIPQIMWLIRDYESKTGLLASELDPSIPTSHRTST